ncbi:hypothetical protein GSI_07855 [Ganoderma sinense ZZ0214-1]|uniref:Uncharacterized protein n=1 Tax=Ganoderma sinense ZZ0214-1 TaxID=1077348 RepID=A0A2G8S878_9APHY|nr:hypothetical protein GSI_07855 [Ganoderma sinense ZZ0214-1]
MLMEMPVHMWSKSSVGGRRDGGVADAVQALFEGTMLKDVSDMDAAMAAVSRLIVDPDTPREEAVAALEAPAHILELVLSAASDDAYRVLVAVILEGYRRNLKGLLASPACRLLSRFALFYHFLPRSSATMDSMADETSRRRSQKAQAGTTVLRELLKLQFDGLWNREPSDDADGQLPFAILIKNGETQRARKRARRENRMPVVDYGVFSAHGITVPQTPAEALLLMRSICGAQCNMLKEYLDMFRRPDIVEAIRKAFLESPSDLPDDSAKEDAIDSDDEDVVDPASASSIHPPKAAMLLDTAEGLGEWHLLFTARAIRDLRQARDGKLFNIFMKKIRELSNGHFSDDNQKRLTAVDLEVPVYEAKMTGDTRLVYQVDCVREPGDEVERQVLKIHGIYTHAQIDRRFRGAIRRHLGEPKGAEYKKRCTFRSPPANPGDNVFAPATWRPRRM